MAPSNFMDFIAQKRKFDFTNLINFTNFMNLK